MMENKDNLLKTALDLFAHRGYEAVGVAEIVCQAGVTKPTLYHYFGSKEGLLMAIIEPRFFDFERELKKATQYDGDLVRSIEQLIQTYLTFVLQNELYFRLYLALIFSPKANRTFELMAPFAQKVKDILLNLFICAGSGHGNIKGHELFLVNALLGLLNHYGLSLLNSEFQMSGSFVVSVGKQYMNGIYAL